MRTRRFVGLGGNCWISKIHSSFCAEFLAIDSEVTGELDCNDRYRVQQVKGYTIMNQVMQSVPDRREGSLISSLRSFLPIMGAALFVLACSAQQDQRQSIPLQRQTLRSL